jgi:polyisoprenyl-phosphate glycosyltransferase
VRRSRPTIDVVVPARNEALTVTSVVAACRECSYVRDVIVVDDGSQDGTTEAASAAGAKVIGVGGQGGSKAHAMEAGVAVSDADAVLFVDADCLNLSAAHLDDICRPFMEGRAVMSLGTFDYGFWNWVVLRFPPTTGERVIPRWVFDAIPPEKLEGFTIEMMINEVVAEGRLPTTARVMTGVTHRTKREKLGRLEGYRETLRMFFDLMALVRKVRVRTYFFYLRGLTIE